MLYSFAMAELFYRQGRKAYKVGLAQRNPAHSDIDYLYTQHCGVDNNDSYLLPEQIRYLC